MRVVHSRSRERLFSCLYRGRYTSGVCGHWKRTSTRRSAITYAKARLLLADQSDACLQRSARAPCAEGRTEGHVGCHRGHNIERAIRIVWESAESHLEDSYFPRHESGFTPHAP